jgi:hypothetical protein
VGKSRSSSYKQRTMESSDHSSLQRSSCRTSFLIDERSTDGASAAIGLAGGQSIAVCLSAPRVEALIPEIRRSAAGELQRADCRLWKDSTREVGGDHQWRIFHTERVKYVTYIHTPGITPNCWEKVPERAFLVHFDWLCRSEARGGRSSDVAIWKVEVQRLWLMANEGRNNQMPAGSPNLQHAAVALQSSAEEIF